jgi:hypothetical protein
MSNKYYSHSGTVGVMGPLLITAFGVIASVLGGVIYGYATHYIPFIYIIFLLTLIYGGFVGWSLGLGGKFGKVRNVPVMLVFGLFFGLVASYTGWSAWIYAASEQRVLAFLPGDIYGVASKLLETGAWSLIAWTPKGMALLGFWIVELLMIVLACMLFTMSGIDEPFCERCNQWVTKNLTYPCRDLLSNPEESIKQMENGDFTPLTSLAKLDKSASEYSEIFLNYCDCCSQTRFLTVEQISISHDSEGAEQKNSDKIIENLILSSEDFESLKASLGSQATV